MSYSLCLECMGEVVLLWWGAPCSPEFVAPV
uniref:Uncharacterized protein n=1 Tax=Siphoviridae sp. ctoic9 TaxID=2825671 RepID=A0A8S5Q882_9CAUD|nr:MAG TPA: hypothetical protein [Siphoviridae sp. ctoic9]